MQCADCHLLELCWPWGVPRGVGTTVTLPATTYEPGEFLWRQGDAYSGLSFVASGCLRLGAVSIDGGERVLGFALPGDLIGYEALAAGFHGCGARALQTTRICRLQWGLREESDYANALAPKLIARLATVAGDALRAAAPESNAMRAVERFLERVTMRLGRREARSLWVDLPMSRADIGNHLGIAEETVTRAFRHLESERGIVVTGRRLCWPLSDGANAAQVRSAAPSRISPA